jgi:3-dehydroquinate dehydratase/shikimate dehydrogenase
MPTLICVAIMVQDEPTAMADAVAARDAGAHLVEFRIDEFFSGQRGAAGELDEREVNTILRLVAGSPLPCIVTCRAASEGGHYDGDDMARVALYERLGTAGNGADPARRAGLPKEHPPRYLDIEFAAYSRSANLAQKMHLAIDYPAHKREPRSGLVLSMHDFKGRPPDLLRRVSQMQCEPAASIVKVAITARSIRDNLELFDLLGENAGNRPMIALGMGPFGLMSRVLAPKFGGFMTFASLRPQSATAPGQPTVRELTEVYRFADIGPRTRVYGVIGWPVEQSLSPLVHNAGFDSMTVDDWDSPKSQPLPGGAGNWANSPESTTEWRGAGGGGGAGGGAQGHDGVYLPLPVPPEYEHFKATLGALIDHPRLDFCGCSVTIPHKQHLVRFARESMKDEEEGIEWSIDALSEACGAANTLVVERDGMGNARRARVVNTDGPAAAAVLTDALGGTASGKRVAILGAGGAGRAIAAALVQAGASVVVCNRTRETAEQLASELSSTSLGRGGSIRGAGLEEVGRESMDAIVNCTPVGMKGGPAPKDSPVSIEGVRMVSPGAVVMDTVYNPMETPMLQQAGLAGMRTVDGLAMFVRQAGMQFTLWTGAAAPMGLFARVAREALVQREKA